MRIWLINSVIVIYSSVISVCLLSFFAKVKMVAIIAIMVDEGI
jgi:hypothetical protein